MRQDLIGDAAIAADLVRAAGTLAEEMRAEGLEARHKSSLSDVVTAADHAAERLIVDHLAIMRPDDGVVGEEGAAVEGTSGRTWVIDPVDGTYNFVSGLDWWCSALALVETDSATGEQDVVLGAVFHPATDVLYLGGPDLPSTSNGVLIPQLVDRPLAQTCVATYLHPPNYSTEVGAVFARGIAGAATVRMLGSGTMDDMAIARGQMGVRLHPSVPPWDWWPGTAIVRGVGGVGRRTTVAGVEWSVSGAPTAVTEVIAALEGR